MKLEMNTVPSYFDRALQGIVHWINYKKQYFDGYAGPGQIPELLPEAVLCSELAQLIAAQISSDEKLACEMLYSPYEKKRVDLTVLKKSSDNHLDNAVFIEIKRAGKNAENPAGYINYIEDDFHKLSAFMVLNKNVRAFQIVKGQTSLPDLLFTEKQEMKKSKVFENEIHYAKPRMSKKSFSSKRKNDKGSFAVLIEIIEKR